MRFGKLGQLSQKLVHNGSAGQVNNEASADAINVEKDKNSTTDSNGGKYILHIIGFSCRVLSQKMNTKQDFLALYYLVMSLSKVSYLSLSIKLFNILLNTQSKCIISPDRYESI